MNVQRAANIAEKNKQYYRKRLASATTKDRSDGVFSIRLASRALANRQKKRHRKQ